MKPTVLIVDDDEDIRTQLKWALNQEYDVSLAGDAPEALRVWNETQPGVVLVDLGLPPRPADPTEGLALITDLLTSDNLVKVIVLTGQSEREVALRAVANGACDLLTKPFQIDELKVILRRATQMADFERACHELTELQHLEAFEGLLGKSEQMRRTLAVIRKVAPTEAPVLILGESGTGKELAAVAIHRHSARNDGPFVPINCGAIPETLLESELFGHEKGAFTGAHVQRKGRVETASGGTLFLDEIGELSPALQVKLLRFLQERSIERVGGREPITVNTRIIAATHLDCSTALRDGTLREDLYYRLAVVVLQLPPLRERGDDIFLLADAFASRFASEAGKKVPPRFSRSALRSLAEHRWPGNIRELENRVRRAVIMSDGRCINESDLELESATANATVPRLKEIRLQAEHELVERALRLHAGNISAAAEDLGISRPTLYELIEKFGIRRSG